MLPIAKKFLHSNMVLFKWEPPPPHARRRLFTFQYGSIQMAY